MHPDILGGVVEGFYGQPWTQSQRFELIDCLSAWGLNTYFYAPKDDLKHRAIWRESYTGPELRQLGELAAACRDKELTFIYGLSPGLDIRFSDSAELAFIQRRLQQLMDVGVRSFALLFDDLPGEMTRDDKDNFSSVAAAQSSVTNATFHWLRQNHAQRLLFCPTPYCDRMVRSNLGGADYLDVIGRELDPEIDVLWTGPEIISREITVASIQPLAERIRRPPVIWDNLHANDYDLRRLFCGPYSGRPLELRDHVRGILANPNNEFPINFIPLSTLGRFLNSESAYEPREAFLSAVDRWLDQYETVKSTISRDDLVLLADCYYLPHAEGPSAEKMFAIIEGLHNRTPAEWGDSFEEFQTIHRRVQHLFEALTELKNRELFYAWSRRVWELKEELDLLDDLFQRRLHGEDDTSGLASETHLPHTYRGGIVARLQRQLNMDAEGRFRRN